MTILKQRADWLEELKPIDRRMKTTRLEAFSDGVLAIIITIMVLELKVPHAVELAALKPLLPVLLSYVLSFIYIGIYWNNHHHLFQATEQVSGGILWANLHLLFWLSLFPFTTGWIGENGLAAIPTAVYGFVLLMAAIAYLILERAIIAKEGRDSFVARAVGRDWKGKLSACALFGRYPTRVCQLHGLPAGLYVFVALLWLVSWTSAADRGTERKLRDSRRQPASVEGPRSPRYVNESPLENSILGQVGRWKSKHLSLPVAAESITGETLLISGSLR